MTSSVVAGHRSSTVPPSLAARYSQVRALTEQLAAPLSAEDQTVQSMPDVSPTKWHRAHVTWFFETFVLGPHLAGYRAFDDEFAFLFNSYYEAVGPRFTRAQRGLITRPGIDEVAAYRAAVDAAMSELFRSDAEITVSVEAIPALIELGLQHEQQHQELLLMDLKHVLSVNPMRPASGIAGAVAGASTSTTPVVVVPDGPDSVWLEFEGGLVDIGHATEGFAFDNEGPRHRVWLEPYRISSRLVTCGSWLEFIDDGGYRRPELWLSEGWATVQAEAWDAPLYWRSDESTTGAWRVFTLDGERAVDPSEPVCHVSHFEADAFARWAGCRLPTEHEWEHAVTHDQPGSYESGRPDGVSLHPAGPTPSADPQWSGQVWQWTSSPYVAYPGFVPAAGAVGEYNGKFMSNQMVLRGGACVTPAGHSRPTYRNFFPSSARWPFAGLRLAAGA